MKSIRGKLYLFIIGIVILLASGSIIISYLYTSKQIDNIYKDITTANAKNFAANLDGDYLVTLRTALESEEYRELYNRAVEEENNDLIQEYLEENGLWNQFVSIRQDIDEYINNMENIKYIYIVAHGDENATEDMYLIDDSEMSLIDTAGRLEERGEEFLGRDVTISNPTITYSSEWGWLCSDYAPVYDSNGNKVCIVGCDIDYKQVATSKKNSLLISVVVTLAVSAIVLSISLIIITKYIINPLNQISNGIKQFHPSLDSIESNVLNLNIKREDEIGEIYDSIRVNQLQIIDYINNITKIKEDLNEKDSKISELSIETFKDALTSVGNKGAYLKKIKELNESNKDYAMVMIDINNLKEMNDNYGHKAGDWYIQGVCQIICKCFKHSPVYRIGGDEFLVVVENEDYINRSMHYQELLKLFELSYNTKTDKPWEQLSASIGMAETSSEDNSAELVFKRADKAMYANKIKFRQKYGSYR